MAEEIDEKKTDTTKKENNAKEALKKAKKIIKEKKTKEQKPAKKQLAKVDDPWGILMYVLMTEKCVRQIELGNEISFITRRNASKKDISDAFETVFESRVKSVRTVIDQQGRKKAYIKLAEPGQAGEIAIKLGII